MLFYANRVIKKNILFFLRKEQYIFKFKLLLPSTQDPAYLENFTYCSSTNIDYILKWFNCQIKNINYFLSAIILYNLE